MERLDKFVATQGVIPRSEAQRLIRTGRVTVDGAAVRNPAAKVDPQTQAVCVAGRPLAYKAHVYLMLNKPAGVLSASRDPRAPTVVDLVPEEWRRKGLFPAGRLDKDTHGLLILTDDGDFAHRMLSPKKAIYKRYLTVLDGPVEKAQLDAFEQGTSLSDGTRLLPAKCRVVQPGEQPLVEISICEGRYHQIKRMFAGIGRKVLWLKRCAVGGLELDGQLEEGACRELTEEERARIFLQAEIFCSN